MRLDKIFIKLLLKNHLNQYKLIFSMVKTKEIVIVPETHWDRETLF